MQHRASTYAKGVYDIYWFEKNILGDVTAVWSDDGVRLISYVYDAWGDTFTRYYNGGNNSTAKKNSMTYRGYYFDSDLQLYYLSTRYYDYVTGRFISPDDLSYLGANGDILSYNLYAYCSNNPIMFTDPSGHSIIAVIAALVVAGTIIGAVASGTIAYYNAKESGGDGDELLQTTIEGAVKGALIGGTVSGIASICGYIIVTCGIPSIAGCSAFTSMVIGGSTILEMSVLQYRSSMDNGRSGWRTAKDIIDTVANNGYQTLYNMCSGLKVSSFSLGLDFVIGTYSSVYQSACKPVVPMIKYASASVSMLLVINSFLVSETAEYANSRGVILK